MHQTIEDFVKTRTAMNQANAQLQNPEITPTVNNGINEFIFVLKRGNYLLPPRADRSFPAASRPRRRAVEQRLRTVVRRSRAAASPTVSPEKICLGSTVNRNVTMVSV